ncbi:MAG: hypothetical protein WCZ18_01890 [Ottowia sp.]|nr:hypothetical protein [Ottowia sp.]
MKTSVEESAERAAWRDGPANLAPCGTEIQGFIVRQLEQAGQQRAYRAS